MNKDAQKTQVGDLRAILLRVVNISEFSRKGELSLATLMRIRAGTVAPTKGNVLLIQAALKRHKPELLPEEPGTPLATGRVCRKQA